MTPLSANVNVMVKAADKAARRLRRDFGETEKLQVSRKGPADFVSGADLAAEKIIREELAAARPDYGFLMEESGASKGSDQQGDKRWIVDPLDGTSNFLHGLPHWAISIALEERGQIIAGVIFDPIKNELFCAEKGAGAFLNDRRIRVSSRRQLGDCLIATGAPYRGHGSRETFLREADLVMGATAGIRRWGTASLDLAYVAMGRFDGFWERGLSAWDIAAGIILLREAGGLVSEISGKSLTLDSPSILAGNQHTHFSLMKLLRQSKQTATQA
ncbi:MAG: inositol monophosphatase family protein [Kiloniellales bacterium]|nr:inositol monophosphatase family protein [Kiloniellales bacterium]